MIEFEEFPKLARLHRDTIITEKIDGTNSAIIITEDGEFATQSRKRIITPSDDNFGFSAWAHANKEDLMRVLGPGRHYGEWWGSGIQRGYGLPKGEKRFWLFNTPRWRDQDLSKALPGLGVVPELYIGDFSTEEIKRVMANLANEGSVASPGWLKPEGVVVYHTASRTAFKTTFDDCDVFGYDGGKTWKGSK